MPPVHPDFVHFPLALITIAFAADVFGFLLQKPAWRSFGWGCLVLGFLGTLAAAGSGWIDMRRAALRHETHELVDLHWRVGLVLAILLTVLVIWRYRLRGAAAPGPRPWFYLLYFAGVFAVLVFQGWFGGELAYAHGAGVAATGQGMVSPAKAKQRLDPAVNALRKLPGFQEHEHPHHEQPGRDGDEKNEGSSAPPGH